MKKTALVLPLIVLPFLSLLAQDAHAKIDVNISNNGGNSSANVKVNNSVNIKSNSTSSTDSHTKVQITTNGETKTYESHEPGNVKIESSDGTAKVEINNEVAGNVNVGDNEEAKEKAEAIENEVKKKIEEKKAEARKKAEELKKDMPSEQKTFFEEIFEKILSFFS